MTTGYEDAKAALDELMNWYSEHANDLDRNEDTTRFHLIDRLVRDVFGWPPEEVTTEDAYDGKYVDYSLGRPATRMIIEAKREGTHFSVPIGITSLIHRIPSLIEA